MLLNPFSFHSPKTLEEALQLHSSLNDCAILAGGTFLLNNLKLRKKSGLKTPAHIINLQKIPELHGIQSKGQHISVGAMTTISELLNSPFITGSSAILKKVCRNLATTPIRNMATVGGNLASRYTWTELGAPLLALEAVLCFADPNSGSEEISVEQFFANSARTSKILKSITIKANAQATLSYQRVSRLGSVDLPLLAVCLKTQIANKRFSNTRVCINNATAFAQRDLILEKFLDGAKAEESTAREALHHLNSPIYDERSDEYKQSIFRVSIKNAILELVKEGKV